MGEIVRKSPLREYLEALFIAVVLALFVVTFIAQSYLVQGHSMEPTLHGGERLLVNKLFFRFMPPRRGDIVVFRYPMDPRRRFIKRVIGVGGNTVAVSEGSVFVNGCRLSERYVVDRTDSDYGPKVVPKGTLFVLGDNRNNSEDSRYPDVGFVPMDSVVGKAFAIYWPLGDLAFPSRGQ